jgi:hypothetical protein
MVFKKVEEIDEDLQLKPVGKEVPRLTLFQMTYRSKMMVETGMIEASDLVSAEALGRAWCLRNGHRYVNVRDMILVREDEASEKATA